MSPRSGSPARAASRRRSRLPESRGGRAARAPPRIGDPRALGDVREASAAEIAVQPVRTERGHVHVDPPVVVDVTEAGSHGVAGEAQAARFRRVEEGPVAAVAEQPAREPRSARGSRQRGALQQEDVQPAVAVEIQEAASRTHGLDHVPLTGAAVDVVEDEPALRGDVLEYGRGRGRRRRRRCLRTATGRPEGARHGQRQEPAAGSRHGGRVYLGARARPAGTPGERALPPAIVPACRARRRGRRWPPSEGGSRRPRAGGAGSS